MEAPFATTLRTHVAWRRSLPAGSAITVSAPRPYSASLNALLPFEDPWTRELFLPLGRWTGYLNNGGDGGDPTASVAVTAQALGVRHVVAISSPSYGPGHSSTQLWLSGPGGEGAQQSIRTISAYQQDGRWSWLETGSVQAFENTARYARRRIRERFDRDLLLAYLSALGVDLTDDARWGDGVIVQQEVSHPRRTVTLEQACADLGLLGTGDSGNDR